MARIPFIQCWKKVTPAHQHNTVLIAFRSWSVLNVRKKILPYLPCTLTDKQLQWWQVGFIQTIFYNYLCLFKHSDQRKIQNTNKLSIHSFFSDSFATCKHLFRAHFNPHWTGQNVNDPSSVKHAVALRIQTAVTCLFDFRNFGVEPPQYQKPNKPFGICLNLPSAVISTSRLR